MEPVEKVLISLRLDNGSDHRLRASVVNQFMD